MKEALPPDPLRSSPPSFTQDRIIEIARERFGLTGMAVQLDSERDQNVRLTTPEGTFLLKISNPADGAAVLEMQTQAMLHVRRGDPVLPVMQPLPTLEGEYLAVAADPSGVDHLVRLFTFLPGEMLPAALLTKDAIAAFGRVVARMGVALKDFSHPVAPYPILWDLRNTAALRPLTEALDARRRRTITRLLDRFEARVEPRLPALPSQFIHNDLTLDNVLLDDDHVVSGIVDFGDLTYAPRVCDLAISLVSLMWGRDDPLETAATTASGYEEVTHLVEGERDVLADLVMARLAALVTIAAWRVERYPENSAYITANVDLAWDLLDRVEGDKLHDALQNDAHRDAAVDDELVVETAVGRPTREQLIARRSAVLGPALSPTTYDDPLYLVRGDGYRLFDDQGHAYIDAYNNVPVVGHANAAVARSIAEQSATLNTNTRYLHEAIVELAERLVASMPGGLDTVMLVNSGSEANDIAWRLARSYTGATGAVVTERAYHGVTTATAALSPEEWVVGKEPEDVTTVSAPDGFRGVHRREDPHWVDAYIGEATERVAGLGRSSAGVAAFYVDSLFTSDGIFDPPSGYLPAIAEVVRAAGGLLVADEVQSGYGRTGSHLWSFARAGLDPDLVTLGKPMGNGHPVAAVVMRRAIAEAFADDTELFSTFGGNPVAARAALAVLDEIERLDLQANAARVGSHLLGSLRDLGEGSDKVGEVRGAGLMIGVELVSDRDARVPDPHAAHRVINAMKESGVLVGVTGRDDNVLKIRPPLVIDLSGADAIVRALESALLG